MIINQTVFQAPVSRANNSPAPQAQQPAQAQPEDRIDAFYRGASNTAKWVSRIDGAVIGAALGVSIGAFVGAAAFGPTGAGAAATLLLFGAGGGYGGYQAFDALSAFGGKIGRNADEQCPARGEAIGRVGTNVALSLLSGNWRGAAADIAIPAVGGAICYALAEKK